MNDLVALVISRHGFLFTLPFTRVYGNSDILLHRPRFGIVRHDKYGKRWHWTINWGRRDFQINHPGELICTETHDPETSRVTRSVEFMGTTYTYYSGHRESYYSNYPKMKAVDAIWIPDVKHREDANATSFGITDTDGMVIDLYEAMQDWYNFRQDLGKGNWEG